MKALGQKTKHKRLESLRSILAKGQAHTIERIHQLREEQEKDAASSPGDELDEARSLAEIETHAGLIELAESRLKAIDSALQRLERGVYGICEECGKEIPLERLQVLPFAAYCIDCQRKRNDALRPGQGSIDEVSRSLWTPPAEMEEALEEQEALAAPEDRLSVRDKEPFGPELGEFERIAPAATAGRRGRIKQHDH